MSDRPTADVVDALVARGDYAQAAAVAASAGDLARAIKLYERIWRFADAVPLAQRLGDRALAARLCLDAGDRAQATRIAAAIPDGDGPELARVAETFAGRGHFAEAAGLAERAGALERAAELHQRAGATLAAARLYERAGRWPEAGRLYEELATDPAPAIAAQATLALGRLLGLLGRPREAAAALQAAARRPETATAASRRLCLELGAMGLAHAAEVIARRLHAADPRLPESAVAIAELELQAAAGREPSALPLRRFSNLRLLGAGALGRVYSAEDGLRGQTVALKILAAGAVSGGPERQGFAAFLREAEASSRLRHHNIVRLHDIDERAGMLVLEYLPGGTLAGVLARKGRLPPASVRRLGLEVLAALAAAHHAGIVHRDVKPANIFFDAAGSAKLADFGAAHLTDFGSTQTAGFIGTLGYLSPEQISGAPITFSADLYGLGVTLFEALTGRLPFPGPDIVAQHLGEPPPRPSSLEPGLDPAHDEVVLRALAKAPHERFASAESMAEAVARWPETESAPAEPAPERAPEAGAPAPAPQAPSLPRQELGPTGRGRLFASVDPRVGRPVLVEELEQPLDEAGREQLQRLAAAGGPQVQRVLALRADGQAITYEALEGEPLEAAALGPEEAAALTPAWSALEGIGLAAAPRLVVRTPGGPVALVVAPRAPAYAGGS
jgi:serine/threonine-protein kinase